MVVGYLATRVALAEIERTDIGRNRGATLLVEHNRTSMIVVVEYAYESLSVKPRPNVSGCDTHKTTY